VEVRQTNDSKVSTSGPIWTLIARYNNDTLFIPYAGLGAAFYDSTDFVGTFGSSIKLSTNWEADVYGRYTDITIDEVPDEFDLSTMTYGIGIKYVFG
jgi:long-subunit fatty acid transport protein